MYAEENGYQEIIRDFKKAIAIWLSKGKERKRVRLDY